MDFLKNAFNRGLDIGSLGVKKGINFLGKLAGNHYENGKRVTSKNWNGNDKFVNSGNIQKRTVNRQKSNIMSVRAEVFGFLKETINDNSVNPELVNASRILLENYDLLNDNCINDLYRGWTECINNRANQQLINELGKYIVDIASRAERENVFSFLEQNKNKNDLGRGIIENIHALLNDRDLIDKEAISSLYSAITSNNDTAITREITTAASRIKLQKVILTLDDNKNNPKLGKDIIENIHALLNDRDLIDKEAISSLYSAITSNNDTAITREITTAASRIKLQKVILTLDDNKNNPKLGKDIIENIHALLNDRDLIDKEAISSLYSAITSNNDTAITREITTAASRIKLQIIVSFLEWHKNNNNLRKDILENIHALLHDSDLIDKEAIGSLYSAITNKNAAAITREITTAASRIKSQIVEIKLVKIVPNLEDKDDEYDVNSKNNLSTINNINTEDTDIEPSDDSVFHIAEAIIAHTFKVDDQKLVSEGKEFSADEIKNKASSLVNSVLSNLKERPLFCILPYIEAEHIVIKRATTKLLAKVCADAFNEIKSNKNVQKYVNKLSDALARYSKNDTPENCENIIEIHKELKKEIESAGHIESVNEVLNAVFMRAAVDKFYKKFGNLSDPNTIIRLKFIFNNLYGRIEENTSFDSYSHRKKFLNNLIYGLGFYPSSVDIELKNLSGKKNVKTTKVLSALGALSKEHALTIKNGKKFEIVNTGSYNDRNCAFRAISIGAGFGPNGYNIVQQKVVEGAQKLLKMWDSLDYVRQDQIARMLGGRVGTSYNLSDVKKLLKEYIDCRGQGFVSGVQNIECLFAAIGLGRPICVSDNQFGKEYAFLPDGKKEDMIRDDYSTFGKPIYVGFISGHAEALLPLDNKGSRKMDNKLPELDKKVSDMKDAISKHISGVIYEATNEQSSLLKIIARDPRHIGESFIEAFLKAPRCKNDKNLFVAMKILVEVDSKLYADKRADAYNLEKEIRIIAKNKASGKLAPSQEEVLQNKLKQFVDIFADKAVEICQKNPLFWDNVKNSIFREW